MDICFDGIFPLFLQFISADLVHKSDASSFLVHINDDTFAFFFDHLHSFMQLFAALAAFGGKDVSGDARRVDTAEDRFVVCPFAFDEYDVFESVAELAERRELELPIFGRQEDCFAFLHEGSLFPTPLAIVSQSVGDEVFDGDEFEVILLSYLFELGQSCHGAVGVHYLDECGSRLESG